MIGYYTNNNVSHAVMNAFSEGGVKTMHIHSFYDNKGKPSIFYGILRGSGIAMRWCKAQGIDYYYVDNGYFDALYIDKNKRKDMSGKYRIVKNDMIEPYTSPPSTTFTRFPLKLLVLPPSPYSAFMFDTTPEDWIGMVLEKAKEHGDEVVIREKGDQTPLEKQLIGFNGTVTFNSMGAMQAVKMGKCLYTTHGIIRNFELFDSIVPYYSYEDLRKFYKGRQYTLKEIGGGLECLSTKSL